MMESICYVGGVKVRKDSSITKRYYRKGEPFLCTKCNKAWQYLRDYTGIADYLMGFPKTGCTKRTCMKCEKK